MPFGYNWPDSPEPVFAAVSHLQTQIFMARQRASPTVISCGPPCSRYPRNTEPPFPHTVTARRPIPAAILPAHSITVHRRECKSNYFPTAHNTTINGKSSFPFREGGRRVPPCLSIFSFLSVVKQISEAVVYYLFKKVGALPSFFVLIQCKNDTNAVILHNAFSSVLPLRPRQSGIIIP